MFCSGLGQLFVINVADAQRDPAKRVWQWKPADSPEIAERSRDRFDVVLECKPVRGGSAVLIAASWRGGVALIRRADKKCLFYAGGTGGHGADLIGDDIVAGAFSTETNELRLYKIDEKAPYVSQPAWQMPLPGAHAVYWDAAGQTLWALGGEELVKLKVTTGAKPSAEVVKKYKLPAAGANDIAPLGDKLLAVSVKDGVYQFDVESGSFSPMPGLAKVAPVKSICRNPLTGQIVYIVGKNQFGDTISFLGGGEIVMKGAKLYKARWIVPAR
jgi:hypothetical protein